MHFVLFFDGHSFPVFLQPFLALPAGQTIECKCLALCVGFAFNNPKLPWSDLLLVGWYCSQQFMISKNSQQSCCLEPVRLTYFLLPFYEKRKLPSPKTFHRYRDSKLIFWGDWLLTLCFVLCFIVFWSCLFQFRTRRIPQVLCHASTTCVAHFTWKPCDVSQVPVCWISCFSELVWDSNFLSNKSHWTYFFCCTLKEKNRKRIRLFNIEVRMLTLSKPEGTQAL